MPNRKIILNCFSFLILTINVSYSSTFGEFILGGGFTSDLSLYHYRNEKDTVAFFGLNTFNLNGRNTQRDYGLISVDLDIHMLYGGNADMFLMQQNELGVRIPWRNAPVTIDLRELFMAVYPKFADISIGRQIVTFGKAMVLSPLDQFSTINILDLNFRRSGSDIVNIRIPLGMLSGLDLIAELPAGSDELASAMKYFTNLAGFDLDLIGIYYHQSGNVLAGAAFKGDMFVGIHGEIVSHFNDQFDFSHLEFMMGADYSLLRNELLLSIEYSYNGAPILSDTLDLQSLWELKSPFFRKHYLFFNTSYMINDLLSVSGNILCNIGDKGVIATLLVQYSLMQNVNVTGVIRGFTGNFYGVSVPSPDIGYSARVELFF